MHLLLFLCFVWETKVKALGCRSGFFSPTHELFLYSVYFSPLTLHGQFKTHFSMSCLLLVVDQFVCHTEAIADIVILVDGSWSIGRLNFRLVRMFLENLVDAFDVGINKTRIGGSLPPNMVCCCLYQCFYSFIWSSLHIGIFFLNVFAHQLCCCFTSSRDKLRYTVIVCVCVL